MYSLLNIDLSTEIIYNLGSRFTYSETTLSLMKHLLRLQNR